MYPQIVGTGPGESDKRAGRTARLLLRGRSTQIITFEKRDETGRRMR